VGAALGYTAVFEGQDQIRVADGTEAVRYHHASTSFEQLTQRRLDQGLRASIYVTRCLVQDEDARVGQYRPGEGEELALALAQGSAALSQTGVVALWQGRDEVMSADGAGGVFDLLPGSVYLAVADVLCDSPSEEERFLQNSRDLLSCPPPSVRPVPPSVPARPRS
jgi:hypothetical protein